MSLVVIAIQLCLLLSFMGFEGDDGDEETKKTMGKKRFISSLTSTRKRRTLHSSLSALEQGRLQEGQPWKQWTMDFGKASHFHCPCTLACLLVSG